LFDKLIWKLEILKILKFRWLKLKLKILVKIKASKIIGKNFLIKELNKLKLKFKINKLKDIKTSKINKIKSMLKIFLL